MTASAHSSAVPSDSREGPFDGPIFLVSACAVVLTASLLGMDILRETFIGVPLGLWIILGGIAARAWSHARSDAFGSARWLGATDHWTLRMEDAIARGLTQLGRWALLGMDYLSERTSIALPAAEAIEARICTAIDRLSVPITPGRHAGRALRIGLGVPRTIEGRLASGDTPVGTLWARLDPSVDPADVCDTLALDAVLRRREDATVEIVCSESEEREAAWYDWATPLPFSFPSIFPPRIDAARATLGDLTAVEPADFELSRLLSIAAACLSRGRSRLTLIDRIRGRVPFDPGCNALDAPTTAVMTAIADHVASREDIVDASVPLRVAARITGAWAAGTLGDETLAQRRNWIEAAAHILPDEPATQLRLVAIRFAMMDDDAGYQALDFAVSAIKDAPRMDIGDHLPFIHAEFEHGGTDPMSLGRVIAGLCLVATATPHDNLPYLEADLIEDMRYSNWLIGRDHDHALLVNIMRHLRGADNQAIAA